MNNPVIQLASLGFPYAYYMFQIAHGGAYITSTADALDSHFASLPILFN